MDSQQPSSAPQASSSSRPPVTLGQSTHLDPGAYVRGKHAITLGDQVLVHPRAQLVTLHGPLSIGDRCIISEKSVLGGPIPSSTSTTSASPATESATKSGGPSKSTLETDDDDEEDPVKTTIGSNVYIHPHSQIQAGATIRDAVLVESQVTVLGNVTIGAHAKICAGVIVDRDVEEWTVVFGNGDVKRRRRHADDAEKQDVVETLRLKAMDKEREGAVSLFRAGARMATLAAAAKKK